MNDQLQQALAAILSKSMDAIQTGVTFLQAELPDVIHQLLMWHAARSGILASISLILAIIFSKWACKAWKHADTFKSYEDGNTGYSILSVVLGVLSLFFACLLVAQSMILMKILISPKIYLIEYAASLVTK